ncbi:hypothetical protein BIU96_14650 [Curtobacterium sp. MCBA15_008]|nr:hypothetical protein BIU96_14650 [Curtobacterium sp. MCBA15_008]
MYPGSSVILIAIVIALDVLAIVQVWKRTMFDTTSKAFWSVVVLVIPYVGAISWLLLWTVARLSGSKAIH